MELSDNLNKNNILLKAKSTTRWELIGEMIEVAIKNKDINSADCNEIRESLIEREKSISTAIGNGVAIPHCTSEKIKDVIFIMSIVPKGVDFDSIDNQPVKIIILIVLPKNKLSQHIKTLANIAKLMSNENLRQKLITLKTPESVIKTIKDFEKGKK